VSKLVEYIRQYALMGARDLNGGGTDMYFFNVKAAPGADAVKLAELIRAHKGAHVEVDVFDAKEHGYIEIGAWLGSQEDALALMGLGVELELWKLLSPRTMVSRKVPADLEDRMVGMGLLSLQAYRQ
jgi:hypothetical protein